MLSPNSSGPIQESIAYRDLSNKISSIDASVVRQVIRDQKAKAILGSQYHIAFLLNAAIHQASNDTLSHAVKDFGARMVQVSKEHVVRHMKADDIDEVADLLLTQASTNFLDKALARRLETIPARQLVNALTRAERLGYHERDIIREGRGGLEHVIPSLSSLTLPPQAKYAPPSCNGPSASYLPFAPHPPSTKLPGVQDAKPVDKSSYSNLFFCSCGWPCSSPQALEYHGKKRCCRNVLPSDQVRKEVCAHCGSRFGSSGGLYYHAKVKVCGEYTQEQTREVTQAIRAFRSKRKASEPMVLSTPSKPLALLPMYCALAQAPDSNGAYASLTPNQKRELDAEMRKNEGYYGALMRTAMTLPEPEKSKHLAALKNRYNTKQSTTRKKFGICLRGRRSKAEIDAEHIRLFGTFAVRT
ncbi:hypothetical protein BGZ63DRAFT_367516 [Mariannaea sp. PMI_226]|nr:hypothetical protein BGZ63DRAFT_367516 [Mariannaea sp. PMI_226]